MRFAFVVWSFSAGTDSEGVLLEERMEAKQLFEAQFEKPVQIQFEGVFEFEVCVLYEPGIKCGVSCVVVTKYAGCFGC